MAKDVNIHQKNGAILFLRVKTRISVRINCAKVQKAVIIKRSSTFLLAS